MNRITKPVKSTVHFVKKHRVAIAVATTTVVCYKAHVNVIADMTKFMEDKGVLNDFYATLEG